MSQFGWPRFKNLAAIPARFLKVCLTILGDDALKGCEKFKKWEELSTVQWTKN